MNPHDHPDLTAHVLGELDAEHAEAMAQWIVENPAARAEADGIADLSKHLHATALMPQVVLHQHQRDAILNGPQLVRKLVEVASQKPKRRYAVMPVLHSIGRIAAAAMLLIAGFLVGMRFTQQSPKQVVAKSEGGPSEASKDTPKQQPFRATEVPSVALVDEPKSVESTAPTLAVAKPAVTEEKKLEQSVVAVIPAAALPAKEAAKPLRAEMKITDETMVVTSKTAVAQVVLHPAKTRPGMVHATSAVSAAPMTGHEKPVVAVPAKKVDLMIHSWKAEIASCPWDESRRLIRLSIQMPGDQEAAMNDQSFPLQVTFQQGFVRSYRQLSQRWVPAPGAGEAAWQVAWFEFVPNGSPTDATREAMGKTIATVTLLNSKFTMAAMGPFETATKLQVVDHGMSWKEASDEFLFEISLTGWRLLMNGTTNTPALNHALVLSLADRTVKDDRTGERARFVKMLREVQKTTGL